MYVNRNLGGCVYFCTYQMWAIRISSEFSIENYSNMQSKMLIYI